MVISDGAYINDEDKDIEFDIPPGAVPKGKQIVMSIDACAAGPFQLPEGYDAVSLFYLLRTSHELRCNITLSVKFNAMGNCGSLAFLYSHDFQPEYEFRVLDKGIFDAQYGRISIPLKNCLFTVGCKKSKDKLQLFPNLSTSTDEKNDNAPVEELVYIVIKLYYCYAITIMKLFVSTPQELSGILSASTDEKQQAVPEAKLVYFTTTILIARVLMATDTAKSYLCLCR